MNHAGYKKGLPKTYRSLRLNKELCIMWWPKHVRYPRACVFFCALLPVCARPLQAVQKMKLEVLRAKYSERYSSHSVGLLRLSTVAVSRNMVEFARRVQRASALADTSRNAVTRWQRL